MFFFIIEKYCTVLYDYSIEINSIQQNDAVFGNESIVCAENSTWLQAQYSLRYSCTRYRSMAKVHSTNSFRYSFTDYRYSYTSSRHNNISQSEVSPTTGSTSSATGRATLATYFFTSFSQFTLGTDMAFHRLLAELRKLQAQLHQL
jgi:hypothetical protein